MSRCNSYVYLFLLGWNSLLFSLQQSFAAKLLTRLKDPCVQKTIDAASASKGKKKLSWGIISQAVFNYVFKEADILKASSKLTEDTIKRKAKVLCWLFIKCTF